MTNTHIESIRVAVANDATPEARAAGIAACRAILATLGASPAEPKIEVGPTAAAIAALVRSSPPDQLLDLVISKLRTLVPADAHKPAVSRMTIPYVKVPAP
jgi:hypothetical protein